MFNNEQQQLYNQSYNASRKLETFLEKYASAAGNEAVIRRGELQLQGLLTEIGLSSGRELTDDEQMFIRSMVSDAARLRDEVRGYGKYFLDINKETYALLDDVMGKEVKKPLIALQAAVRQTKAGDRHCLDAVLTQLLMICSSFVLLMPDETGARGRYVSEYLGKTRRYLQKEGLEPSQEVCELMDQVMNGKYGASAVKASHLSDREHVLEFGGTEDNTETGSRLDALSAMIDENLNTLKDLSSTDNGNGRVQKSLSSLVDDFFGAGPKGENTDSVHGVASGPEADPVGVGSSADSPLNPVLSVAAAGGNRDQKNAQEASAAASPEPQLDLSAEDAQEKIDEILEELNNLIGLTTVKEEVSSLINVQKVNIKRKEMGLKEADVSKHLVFSGNPGTGKTTVARILAKVYHALGLLKQGQLVEVDRAGLVAGYIGQTAIKTKEVIDSAMGGILFIDEAYTLSANKGEGDFGQEAIDTILKAMEDHRDEFIVIVAGYTDLMEEFLDSNPGLRSRFNKFIHFPDYTPEELRRIFEFTAGKNGYKVSQDALDYLQNYYTMKLALAEPNFANARDARNIFEKAVTRQANRLADKADCTKEELELLTLADITGDLPKGGEELTQIMKDVIADNASLSVLENEDLRIEVEERGAQLSRVYDKKNGHEILWEGKEPFWKYHAPILFPIVGRVANNEYRFDGKTYSLPQHGFARVSDFTKTETKAEQTLAYLLEDSAKTLEVYPFRFRLGVKYVLEGRNLKIRWTVNNPSENETMYFSIGAHPAFTTPLDPGEAKKEYFVHFEDDPAPEYILFNKESGLAVPDRKYVMETDGGYLQLKDHLFDIDTFIFEGGQIRSISICRPDRTPYVRVRCDGFPYFGLWTQNDEAPFVCLEPWYGRLDDEGFTGDLCEKTGIQTLNAGETFEAEYTIEVL